MIKKTLQEIKDLLDESISKFVPIDKNVKIDFKTLENYFNKNQSSFFSDDRKNIKFLIDFYHDEGDVGEKEINWYLNNAGKNIGKALNFLRKKAKGIKVFYEFHDIIKEIAEGVSNEFKVDFPIPFYVTASKNDPYSIGLLVHENGKIERFEGSDESSDETRMAVKKILGELKDVRVYSNQPLDVIEKIKKTGFAPKGMYVSPDKKHAEGYWSMTHERAMVSFVINEMYLAKESFVDWRILKKTKVDKFKYL